MYYTVCYFIGICYAVVRQISVLFIDNTDSVSYRLCHDGVLEYTKYGDHGGNSLTVFLGILVRFLVWSFSSRNNWTLSRKSVTYMLAAEANQRPTRNRMDQGNKLFISTCWRGAGVGKYKKGKVSCNKERMKWNHLAFRWLKSRRNETERTKKERKPTNHKVVMTKPEQAHTGLLEVVGGVDNGGL